MGRNNHVEEFSGRNAVAGYKSVSVTVPQHDTDADGEFNLSVEGLREPVAGAYDPLESGDAKATVGTTSDEVTVATVDIDSGNSPVTGGTDITGFDAVIFGE
jgi:hypothetical protein